MFSLLLLIISIKSIKLLLFQLKNIQAFIFFSETKRLLSWNKTVRNAHTWTGFWLLHSCVSTLAVSDENIESWDESKAEMLIRVAKGSLLEWWFSNQRTTTSLHQRNMKSSQQTSAYKDTDTKQAKPEKENRIECINVAM